MRSNDIETLSQKKVSAVAISALLILGLAGCTPSPTDGGLSPKQFAALPASNKIGDVDVALVDKSTEYKELADKMPIFGGKDCTIAGFFKIEHTKYSFETDGSKISGYWRQYDSVASSEKALGLADACRLESKRKVKPEIISGSQLRIVEFREETSLELTYRGVVAYITAAKDDPSIKDAHHWANAVIQQIDKAAS